ncbi:MAG TPA: nitroreductase family deazaflavin-dependent oxidoreductase [Sporichthya sp.]|nr:nitroreductase family deazaflavin-dependent oxidoreductase [Sporichthya sp.]
MTTEVKDSPTGWVKEHIERYVATGGEEGHEWRGVPTLLLTTTGRRTGQRRRTALIYGQDGEDFVLVASQGGAPRHPAWYLNLTAHPDVEVQVGDKVFSATARTADPATRARLWPRMVEIWPDYAEYVKKTDREIPVVVLTQA